MAVCAKLCDGIMFCLVVLCAAAAALSFATEIKLNTVFYFLYVRRYSDVGCSARAH